MIPLVLTVAYTPAWLLGMAGLVVAEVASRLTGRAVEEWS